MPNSSAYSAYCYIVPEVPIIVPSPYSAYWYIVPEVPVNSA